MRDLERSLLEIHTGAIRVSRTRDSMRLPLISSCARYRYTRTGILPFSVSVALLFLSSLLPRKRRSFAVASLHFRRQERV